MNASNSSLNSSVTTIAETDDDSTHPAVVIATQLLLFCLFFGLAATVDLASFKSKFKELRGICTGLVCQFLFVPALGFLSCKLFDLDAVTGVQRRRRLI